MKCIVTVLVLASAALAFSPHKVHNNFHHNPAHADDATTRTRTRTRTTARITTRRLHSTTSSITVDDTTAEKKDSYESLDHVLQAKCKDEQVRGVIRDMLDVCADITQALLQDCCFSKTNNQRE